MRGAAERTVRQSVSQPASQEVQPASEHPDSQSMDQHRQPPSQSARQSVSPAQPANQSASQSVSPASRS
eukprot:1691233-Heterocapsa_arctica.AAC.1